MVEPEMAFADLDRIIILAEKLVKYVAIFVLTNNRNELEYLENYEKKGQKKEIISKLKKIVEQPFERINYSQCVEILAKNKKNFIFNDIK
jgi:asparaginyl-tRNA synthetase